LEARLPHGEEPATTDLSGVKRWRSETCEIAAATDAIEGAFNNIGHAALVQAIGNFPARELIKQWLKAGYVEDEMFTPRRRAYRKVVW
jgi:hypothetical protein